MGVVGGFVGAVAMAWRGGLPLGGAVLLMAVFGAYMLALARIRAEAGTAWNFGPAVTAPDMVVRSVGPMHLPLGGISVLAYHSWYNLDYRSMTTPHLFEAFRIADHGRLELRRLAGGMALAVVVGLACASWTVLHLYYTAGAGTAHVNPWRINMGKIPYQLATAQVGETNTGPDAPGLVAVGAGAAITLVLNAARAAFPRWPFHPAGYAIANTSIPDLLWFPFLLGWLAKALTLRYSGMYAYRRLLPLAVGLILGDYVIASLWTLVGLALGMDMYRCFPN